MSAMETYDHDRILTDIVAMLRDMMIDWDTDAGDDIERDTDIIADLGFVSVDIIQLIVAVENHFKRRDLAFDRLLMRDGAYVSALHVGEVVDHLQSRLSMVPV
jgi:acyl carrier protein